MGGCSQVFVSNLSYSVNHCSYRCQYLASNVSLFQVATLSADLEDLPAICEYSKGLAGHAVEYSYS